MSDVNELDGTGQFHLRSLFVVLNVFHHASARGSSLRTIGSK
jgi:hypothetical protein